MVVSSIYLEEQTTRRVRPFLKPLRHSIRHSTCPDMEKSTSCLCTVSSCRNRKLICLVNFQCQKSSAILSLAPHTGMYLIFGASSIQPLILGQHYNTRKGCHPHAYQLRVKTALGQLPTFGNVLSCFLSFRFGKDYLFLPCTCTRGNTLHDTVLFLLPKTDTGFGKLNRNHF